MTIRTDSKPGNGMKMSFLANSHRIFDPQPDNLGISFFKGVGWVTFFKVILMSLIEVQNVFLMINFDV